MKIRYALVTGAGGVGCGRAIARRLAKKGAHVVACDLDELGAHETARLIQKEGGRATAVGCDVRNADAVADTVALAARELGGLDCLVNDASAPFRPQAPLENWSDTIATDLLGTMAATRAAIDVMKKRQVVRSSTSARRRRARTRTHARRGLQAPARHHRRISA